MRACQFPIEFGNSVPYRTASATTTLSSSLLDAEPPPAASKTLCIRSIQPPAEEKQVDVFLHPPSTSLFVSSSHRVSCLHHSLIMSDPPIFVQAKRRKQIFTFLLDGSSTIAQVKSKISAVAAQHDVPEASEDAMLLLDSGAQTQDDATLASVVADGSNKGAASEGVTFHLVYAIGDNEYEPVEVESTRQDA